MVRPKLYQVFPTNEYQVYLYYDNGEIKKYDCRWILNETGIFKELSDVDVFMNLCTIMNNTLTFDISRIRDPYHCVDICPDTIYNESVKCGRDILLQVM